LNDIELNLLGDIKGKSVLHLQCHFGQDTISLSRLGARAVGVDLSDKAIAKAREIALQTQSDAEFICCNLYDLPQYITQQTFDIVFTSYGTIGWLPDLDKWATIIATCLKPNGRFVLVDFHPVVWMFDDNFEKIAYNYFNTGAIVETLSGTYADPTANINNGLEINAFDEYDYSPYNCFRHTIETAPKKYRIRHLDNKIPMLFSIAAAKK